MDTKRKILIVSLKGPTKQKKKGGAQEYMALLAKYLVQSDYQVDILCGQEYHDGVKLPAAEDIEGARVIRVNSIMGRPLSIFWAAKKTHRRYGLIIENMMAYPLFMPFLIGHDRLITLRHHLQGSHVFHLQGYVKGVVGWFLEQVLEPVFYRHSYRVAASGVTRRAMYRLWLKPVHAVRIIPPGFEHQEKGEEKTAFPSIFYIGALHTSRKRVDHLIQAFRSVVERRPDSRLYIAGQGPHEKALKLEANELPVQFLGFLSDDQKHVWLSKAWIFASPSTKEGFGITWVEANAHGTPVVGYDLGLDTVNPECAIMVEEGNIEGLSVALLSIIEDERKRKRMYAAAKLNASRFSWQSTGEKWVNLIKELMQGRNG